MKTLQTMGAAAVLALLAACGGGNEPIAAVVDNTTVPADATASVAAFSSYAGAMVANANDRAEPLNVDAVTPPTSDTTEPVDVM